MLFLLNDRVIDIEAPEARVMSRWREIGCGDPAHLRAHEAVEFVKSRLRSSLPECAIALTETHKDLAALIVSKTGANSLFLHPTASGDFEPRLRDVPAIVLEAYQRGAANDRDERARA